MMIDQATRYLNKLVDEGKAFDRGEYQEWLKKEASKADTKKASKLISSKGI